MCVSIEWYIHAVCKFDAGVEVAWASVRLGSQMTGDAAASCSPSSSFFSSSPRSSAFSASLFDVRLDLWAYDWNVYIGWKNMIFQLLKLTTWNYRNEPKMKILLPTHLNTLLSLQANFSYLCSRSWHGSFSLCPSFGFGHLRARECLHSESSMLKDAVIATVNRIW